MFEIERPLLSVIIPTYNRSDYLPRAVQSALNSAPDGSVEVIVIPNGGDESWKVSLADYLDNEKVIISPIQIGHACAARNHGLKLARGNFLRFLDDDDYLYCENAQLQLKFQIDVNVDISYAYVDSVNSFGNIIKKHYINKNMNFFDTVFLPISTPLHGFLYKRSVLEDIVWRETVQKRQDVYWLFDVLEKVEPNFSIFAETVGVWVHHAGKRVSTGHSIDMVSKETVKRTLEVYQTLKIENRLNFSRSYTISTRLWRCVHDGMMHDPFYWVGIAKIAKKISYNANPATSVYMKRFFIISPLFWELLIVPFRWLKVLFKHEYKI